jgi:uncharacterized membrane protein
VLRSGVAAASVAVLACLLIATAVGMALLWPRDRTLEQAEGTRLPKTEEGEVRAVEADACRIPDIPGCRRVTVDLRSGPDEGTDASFDAGSEFDVQVGDLVRVYRTEVPPEAQVGGMAADAYALADFERRGSLVWLAVAFALLVVVTGRLRGLRALVGLGASLAIILFFIVPAILDGRSPLAVAIVGALAVMLATIPLTHGLGAKTVAACLGTAASLGVIAGLASAAVGFAHLSGFTSEEAVFLRVSRSDLSLEGLLLAGMVIGALGVLDDLTVTQASTVLALRRANPALGTRGLFRSALVVGHDHIAATVNTLVLAYAGAALPVLLIFSLSETSFSDAVNSEVVAAEVVAMLVGSIGLIVAVPITTFLAALLASRLGDRDLPRVAHAHAH